MIEVVVATLAVAAWYLIDRWWRLRQTGQYDVRREWKVWLSIATGVVLINLAAYAGRLTLLAIGPFILIPAGVVLLSKAEALKATTGQNFRPLGWITIITGAMYGFAVVIDLLLPLL